MSVPDAGYTPEPLRDCPLCPRLHNFLQAWRQAEPSWNNAPVAPFFPVGGMQTTRLLIVGLVRPVCAVPTAQGRPFTGDYAGELLYTTMKEFGFARGVFEARSDDSLELIAAAIVNAVRCIPPQNKPLEQKIKLAGAFCPSSAQPACTACCHHARRDRTSISVRPFGGRPAARHPFGHGRLTDIGYLRIFSSITAHATIQTPVF